VHPGWVSLRVGGQDNAISCFVLAGRQYAAQEGVAAAGPVIRERNVGKVVEYSVGLEEKHVGRDQCRGDHHRIEALGQFSRLLAATSLPGGQPILVKASRAGNVFPCGE
jgi:hypothetical protein